MQISAAERIAAELDRVHLALREGRLDALSGAAALMEAQIDGLSGADIAALDMLRRRAARNAACLEAARRGVRAARRRLAEVGAMDGGFVSYDMRGKRDETPVATGQLVQRL